MKICKSIIAPWALFPVSCIFYMVQDGALRIAQDKGNLAEAHLTLALFLVAPPTVIYLVTKMFLKLNLYLKSKR